MLSKLTLNPVEKRVITDPLLFASLSYMVLYVMFKLKFIYPLNSIQTSGIDQLLVLLSVMLIPIGILISSMAVEEKAADEFDFLTQYKLGQLIKVVGDENYYKLGLQVIYLMWSLLILIVAVNLTYATDSIRLIIQEIELYILVFGSQFTYSYLRHKKNKCRTSLLSILIPEYKEKLESERQAKEELKLAEAHLPWHKRRL